MSLQSEMQNYLHLPSREGVSYRFNKILFCFERKRISEGDWEKFVPNSEQLDIVVAKIIKRATSKEVLESEVEKFFDSAISESKRKRNSTKFCPKCGSTALVKFKSINKKVCNRCSTEIEWTTDENQKSLITPSRDSDYIEKKDDRKY